MTRKLSEQNSLCLVFIAWLRKPTLSPCWIYFSDREVRGVPSGHRMFARSHWFRSSSCLLIARALWSSILICLYCRRSPYNRAFWLSRNVWENLRFSSFFRSYSTSRTELKVLSLSGSTRETVTGLGVFLIRLLFEFGTLKTWKMSPVLAMEIFLSVLRLYYFLIIENQPH